MYVGQTSRSRGKTNMVPGDRSCHKEYTWTYESPITSGKKVMAKVKAF